MWRCGGSLSLSPTILDTGMVDTERAGFILPAFFGGKGTQFRERKLFF